MSIVSQSVLGPILPKLKLKNDSDRWKPCGNCEHYEQGFPCANCHTTYLGKYDDCQECVNYSKEVNDGIDHCCIACKNKMITYWQEKNEEDEPDSNCSDFEEGEDDFNCSDFEEGEERDDEKEGEGMQVCKKCNSDMEDDFCSTCDCPLL